MSQIKKRTELKTLNVKTPNNASMRAIQTPVSPTQFWLQRLSLMYHSSWLLLRYLGTSYMPETK